MAAVLTTAGFVALIDGAFLQRWQRDRFRELATRLGIPFIVVAFSASEPTLRQRVAERSLRGTDASDADTRVLEHQLRARQALGRDEESDAVAYDAEAPLDAARSSHAWRGVLERLVATVPGESAEANWSGVAM